MVTEPSEIIINGVKYLLVPADEDIKKQDESWEEFDPYGHIPFNEAMAKLFNKDYKFENGKWFRKVQ